MDDLDLGQRLSLPYKIKDETEDETQEKCISVPAEITGLGLPAVRVETDSGEVFIRHARNVREWTRHLRHA
jgi:hypothetical protein